MSAAVDDLADEMATLAALTWAIEAPCCLEEIVVRTMEQESVVGAAKPRRDTLGCNAAIRASDKSEGGANRPEEDTVMCNAAISSCENGEGRGDKLQSSTTTCDADISAWTQLPAVEKEIWREEAAELQAKYDEDYRRFREQGGMNPSDRCLPMTCG